MAGSSHALPRSPVSSVVNWIETSVQVPINGLDASAESVIPYGSTTDTGLADAAPLQHRIRGLRKRAREIADLI